MSKKPQLSLLTIGVSVATLLLASTPSLAGTAYKGENYKGEAPAPCPVETMLKDGFYVGAQVGYDVYRLRDNVDFVSPLGDELSTNPALNARGWAGGLFLGYGKYWDNFYLAGEIFANASGAKSDVSTTFIDSVGDEFSSETDVKVKSEYGVSLLPGVRINNNSLFYLRVGYNWARVKASTDVDIDTAAFVLSGGGSDSSKTVHGWSGGLGIETLLADSWSVRAEYNYTKYKNTKFGDNDEFEGESNSSIKLSDNQFMMSLIYHIV